MDSEQRYLRDVGRLAAEDHELKTELSAREEEVAEAIEKRDGVKCRVLKIEQQLLVSKILLRNVLPSDHSLDSSAGVRNSFSTPHHDTTGESANRQTHGHTS